VIAVAWTHAEQTHAKGRALLQIFIVT